MLQHYELLYIVPGTKTEEEARIEIPKVHALLATQGATNVKSDFWGKRKLAYEIDRVRYGYYDAVEFDLDSLKLSALEANLRLAEAVLRHQVVRRKVLTAEQQTAAQQLRERIAARREAAKEKEAAGMITQEEPAVKPPAVPTGPVQKKQLEEKLEEILESDKVEL